MTTLLDRTCVVTILFKFLHPVPNIQQIKAFD
jgi:hypothetical protein